MFCKSYAKSWPWESSWVLVWQSKSGSSAIWSAEISVAIGNSKVKHFVCVFVCFLFFYGYKIENRWVQKTQLPFTAAKLYISDLLWVTRQRAAACPSPGTDSPKLCSLEKSDILQIQTKEFFPFPMWPGQCPFVCWLQRAQAGCWCSRSLPPSGCAAMGTRSVSQSIRIPSVLHKSLPSVKHLFRSKEQLSTSRQAWNLRRTGSAITHTSDMRNLPGDFLLCHLTWFIPCNSFPYKCLSHEDTITICPATMRLGFVTPVNLTLPHSLGNKAISSILSKSMEILWWLSTDSTASNTMAREGI